MKTKIVYVLTGKGDDRYTAMLLLSLHTLRRYNPSAEVVVAMDEPTRSALEQLHSPILSDASQAIVPIPSGYNPMQRSRYIKTTLREHIDGDFLYIDGDTFISGRMDDIDKVKEDVAMAADRNCESALEGIVWGANNARQAGFQDQQGEPHFNGGVIFVRDTPPAHELFRKWHECWKVSVAKGVSVDQPALYEANRLLGHPIKELSGIWNCQYKCWGFAYYKKYLKDARVLHYFSMFNMGRVLGALLDHVRAKGRVDFAVAMLMRWPRLLVYENQLVEFLSKIRGK